MVLPAAFQKETPPYWDGVSFWSGRRGSLAAQPGRHTHAGTKTCPRHVSLAPLVLGSSLCPAGKCKKTPPCWDGVSFWSGRRGSLAARPGRHTHAGTKTCPRHVSLASLVPCSSLCPAGKYKKKTPSYWDGVSFWSGRRGSNSLPRPWQGRALPDELRPQNNGYYSA